MGNLQVRRASAAEVLAIAEPLLPDTVQVVADLRGAGVARRVRPYVLHRGDRALGAVVLGERCRGRWYASPVLLDADAAPAMAKFIDGSRAWDVGGASPHVEPLVPHITRTVRRQPIRETFYAAEIPSVVYPVDPRCRMAQPGELDALVDLYGEYEFSRFPTRRRQIAFLRRQLANLPVLVAEIDGVLAAGYLCLYRAPNWDMWGDLTVRPDYRRRGLGTALGVAGVVVSQDAGQRMCGVQAGSNPMPSDERIRAFEEADGVHTDIHVWTQQALQAPRLFPGHRRLRRAVERLEGRVQRRPTLDRVDSAGS